MTCAVTEPMRFPAVRQAAEAVRRRYEDHDPCTMRHSVRVAEWAVLLARNLPDFPVERLQRLEITALLHDIGKTFLDGALIRKRGRLSPSEWTQVRQHPTLGADAAGLPAQWVDTEAIRFHHKRFDGRGYPDGPEWGYMLPLEARLIAVADIFDALTSKRPYRKGGAAYPAPVALDMMDRMRGRELDPGLVVLWRAVYARECRRAGGREVGTDTLQVRSFLWMELQRAVRITRELADDREDIDVDRVVERLARANLDPVSARNIARKVLELPLEETFPPRTLRAPPVRVEPPPGIKTNHHEVLLYLARLPETLGYAQVVVFEGNLWLNVSERARGGFEVRLVS